MKLFDFSQYLRSSAAQNLGYFFFFLPNLRIMPIGLSQ